MRTSIPYFRISKVVEALGTSLLLLLLISCSTSTQPANQSPATAAADPLPSWNDGAAKQAMVDFVRTTTDKNNPKFVPPEERIAAFDQDGTMWVEQPIYTQVLFTFDRIT